MGMPLNTLDYAHVLRQGIRWMLCSIQSIPEFVLGSDSCCFFRQEELLLEFLPSVIPGLGPRNSEHHRWCSSGGFFFTEEVFFGYGLGTVGESTIVLADGSHAEAQYPCESAHALE